MLTQESRTADFPRSGVFIAVYLIRISSYSRVPRPIFSAWARQSCQLVFGYTSRKGSFRRFHPGCFRWSDSWVFGRGSALLYEDWHVQSQLGVIV